MRGGVGASFPGPCGPGQGSGLSPMNNRRPRQNLHLGLGARLEKITFTNWIWGQSGNERSTWGLLHSVNQGGGDGEAGKKLKNRG